MLIHVPVLENRIAQFAARFERRGDGWVYYPDPQAGGLPLNDVEHASLLASYRRTLVRANRWMLIWVFVAAALIVAFEIKRGSQLSNWERGLVILAPLPLVLWVWRRADRAPMTLLGGRYESTAPRPPDVARLSRIAAIPWSVSLLLIASSAVLLWEERHGPALWIVGAAAGLAIGGWLAWIKFQARR